MNKIIAVVTLIIFILIGYGFVNNTRQQASDTEALNNSTVPVLGRQDNEISGKTEHNAERKEWVKSDRKEMILRLEALLAREEEREVICLFEGNYIENEIEYFIFPVYCKQEEQGIFWEYVAWINPETSAVYRNLYDDDGLYTGKEYIGNIDNITIDFETATGQVESSPAIDEDTASDYILELLYGHREMAELSEFDRDNMGLLSYGQKEEFNRSYYHFELYEAGHSDHLASVYDVYFDMYTGECYILSPRSFIGRNEFIFIGRF